MDAWRTGSALSSLLRIVSTSRCYSTNKSDLSFTSRSSFSNAFILYSVNACDSQLCGLFSICCRKIGNFGENTNTQFPLVRKKFHSNSAFIFRHNFKETRGIYIVLEIWNAIQKQWRQHGCFWSNEVVDNCEFQSGNFCQNMTWHILRSTETGTVLCHWGFWRLKVNWG